jgi:hypothetical protein
MAACKRSIAETIKSDKPSDILAPTEKPLSKESDKQDCIHTNILRYCISNHIVCVRKAVIALEKASNNYSGMKTSFTIQEIHSKN